MLFLLQATKDLRRNSREKPWAVEMMPVSDWLTVDAMLCRVSGHHFIQMERFVSEAALCLCPLYSCLKVSVLYQSNRASHKDFKLNVLYD